MGRRLDILRAAGDLFRRRGYHATSVRDLAAELDMRGSSLYAHFGGKEELLAEIVDEAADAFLAAAEGVDAGLEPAARLRALVRAHLGVIQEHLSTATVFLHEWRFLAPERRARVVERRDAYQAHVRRAIEDGVASGAFRAPDPALATLFVLSSLNWTYQWLRPDGPLPPSELADRYADHVLAALGAAPAGSTIPAAPTEPAAAVPPPRDGGDD